jgi:hypothetical protein
MHERCWRWMLIVVISLQLISGTADAEENPYTANGLLQGCQATLREGVTVPRPFYSGCAWAWMPGCTTLMLRAAHQTTQPTIS